MQTDDVQIKHHYDVHELATMGREQAEHLDKLSGLKKDLESVKKQYNASIAEAEAAAQRISSKVFSGWEMRSIKCAMVDERPAGYRLLVRLDNGHIARRRKLDTHERQLELTTEPPKPFVATATFHVDDESWDTDAFELNLTEEEFEAFRKLDLINVRSFVPASRRLHDADGNAANRARSIPTDPDAPEWRTGEEIAAGVPHHITESGNPVMQAPPQSKNGKKKKR